MFYIYLWSTKLKQKISLFVDNIIFNHDTFFFFICFWYPGSLRYSFPCSVPRSSLLFLLLTSFVPPLVISHVTLRYMITFTGTSVRRSWGMCCCLPHRTVPGVLLPLQDLQHWSMSIAEPSAGQHLDLLHKRTLHLLIRMPHLELMTSCMQSLEDSGLKHCIPPYDWQCDLPLCPLPGNHYRLSRRNVIAKSLGITC